MKQFLIFAVILLATLSMVNAAPLHKRETQFGQCPPIPKVPKQPDLIQSISISPDPIVAGQDVTFTISTTLTRDITTDDKLIIGFADLTGKVLQDLSIFDIPKGISAGQKYETKQTLNAPAGATTTPGYAIGVAISTLSNPPDAVGCALAIVTGSSSESYPIASYPIASYPIAGRSYPIAEKVPGSYFIAERSA